MTFLVVLIAISLLRASPLLDRFQNDRWLLLWNKALSQLPVKEKPQNDLDKQNDFESRVTLSSAIYWLLLVTLPCLLCWFVVDYANGITPLLALLLSLVVLLYCVGRGNVTELATGYLLAFHRGDTVVATEYARRLGMDVDDIEDWPELHRGVLRRVAYRFTERVLSPVLWFCFLGPAGALLYRLSALTSKGVVDQPTVRALSAHMLWLLEWPVVRVIGISFALTGNFVGCFQRFRELLVCFKRPTDVALAHCVEGALSVNAGAVEAETVTDRDIDAITPLLHRTLVLWLVVLALFTIF